MRTSGERRRRSLSARGGVGMALLACMGGALGQSRVCRDDAGQGFIVRAEQTVPSQWRCVGMREEVMNGAATVAVGARTVKPSDAGHEPASAEGADRPRGGVRRGGGLLLKDAALRAPETARSGAQAALKLAALAEAGASGAGLVLAPGIGRAATSNPSRVNLKSAAMYDTLIRRAALEHGHDSNLLRAIVHVESRFNASAVSHKGAIGLMQVMPATAAGLGLADARRTLFEPETNLNTGALYLRRLAVRFENNLELMVAAYNAGETAVARYRNTVPPYPETQNYVRSVLAAYRSLSDGL